MAAVLPASWMAIRWMWSFRAAASVSAFVTLDAPERGQPYGHRSRKTLIALCGGEAAQLDGNKHDRNGRLLAHVRCNGTDAPAEQVRRGMAWVFVRYAPADSPLHAMEAKAMAARLGL